MKRSAPAVHVRVERFQLWHGTVIVLVLASAAGLAAWLAAMAEAAGDVGAFPLPVVFFAVASFFALACSLFALRPCPASLRWDGQGWHLGPMSSVGSEPWPVELTVRLDLGVWMLIQIRSSTPGFPRDRAWLPIQRSGLAGPWHGLRCALFAPALRRPTEGAVEA